MAVSVEKKTIKTTFMDNFRSSRPEVFQTIWKNCKEKILVGVFLLIKSKRIYYHECFPRNFLEFSEHLEHLRLAGFFHSLKFSGWMTVIYFFLGHLHVFWVFFTSIRVTLELLPINVEKPLWWGLQIHLFFCLYWRRYFLIWWGTIVDRFFDSINQ